MKTFFKLFIAFVIFVIIYAGSQIAIYHTFSGLNDAVSDYGHGIDSHITPLYTGFQNVFNIVFGIIFVGLVIGMIASVIYKRPETPTVSGRWYNEFER